MMNQWLNAPLTINAYLIVSSLVFVISLAGILLNRENLIRVLMCIELMLLAVNLNFIAFSASLHQIMGQIFVFFILTVAAAESAIGLAIIVTLYRKRHTIAVKDLSLLKG